MAFPAPEFRESISTPPKLSLFSLPTTLLDGPTPPPNTVATIPFLWEEAPGKPRTTSTSTHDPPKSKTVRSLDLPPRLTTTAVATSNLTNINGGIQIIPSPTTVLGGPYDGVYTSKSMLGSPEKAVVSSNSSKITKGKIRMPLRNLMRKERSPVKFNSWRWDNRTFRDIRSDDRGDRSPPVRFCSWRWDSFRDMGGGKSGGGGSLSSSFSLDSNSNKIGKVTRKNSFTFVNRTASGFLADMYGTFKHAMQWRSRR